MNPYFLPPLHEWQLDAIAKLIAVKQNGATDFLLVASVGSGKTRFALEVAAKMLASGEVERVVVLTNTTHLVKQWGRTASRLGINLIQAFGNKELAEGIPADALGYVCTYASMASWSELHEAFCHSRKTLIIFDEIHHLADVDNEEKATVWGDKAKQCFADVAFRLSLSGTPFRTEGTRLPFIRYKPAKNDPSKFVCDADFEFPYGQAVAYEICRKAIFKPYDAESDWDRKIMFTESSMDFNLAFSEKVKDPIVAQTRLKASTAIGQLDDIPSDLSNSRWPLLIKMLRDADQKLRDIRASDHPDAAGIIVCAFADHAKGVAKLFKRITKSQAIVVLHEDPASARALDAFDEGTTPWIISVRMVSEGVDIPRLRVCVYLSWWVSVLYFLQVLGRIVRYPEHNPSSPWGEAYFYFPADERLLAISHQVEDEIEQYLRDKKRGPGGGGGGKSDWTAHFADGEQTENVASGDFFDPGAIEQADRARQNLGLGRVSLVDLLRFYQEMKAARPGPSETKGDFTQSYSERRDTLREDAQQLVGKLSYLTNRPHDHLHHEANEQVGIRKGTKPTTEQLERKVVWLREQIEIAKATANAGQ